MNRSLQALVLVLSPAVAAPALAQNYRLSPELPSNWNELVDGFVVRGDTVVFSVRPRSGAPDVLYAAPADGSAAPVKLYDGAELGVPMGAAFDVTADGQWVVFEIVFATSSRLAAVRPDGTGGRLVSDPFVDGGYVAEFALSPDSQRVVYLADQDADEVFELYGRVIDSQGPSVELSGAPLAGGDVREGFRVGGGRVVYRADHEADEVVDLWSAPLDGSASPERLNVTRPLADVQADFVLSNDGLGVVYRADTDVDESFELFVVPIDGVGAPLKRSGALSPTADVQSFRIGPLDARLFFVADALSDSRFELFSVPTFAGAPVKLSGTMTTGGDVRDYRASADGQRVVFTADRETDETVELYAVGASGGTPLKLHASLGTGKDVRAFAIAPDSARVALTADLDVVGVALYTVPIDASAAPLRLSEVPVSGQRRVDSFRFAAGGTRLVYASDQDVQGLYELHSVPADGSAAPVELNERLGSGTPLMGAYDLTADGTRVVYAATQAIDAMQVWSVPVAGGPTTRLNPTLDRGPIGDVQQLMLSPDGAHAYFVTYRNVYFTGGDAYDLFRVGLDDPRSAQRLCGPNLRDVSLSLEGVSPDGRWVAYRTPPSGGSPSLFVVPGDGSTEPVRLGPTSSAQFDGFTSDSARVVFRAGGLRSAPLDGSGASVLLDTGNLVTVRIAPDSSRVVYMKSLATRYELWSVPMLGGAPVRLDAGPGGLVHNGSTQGKPFEITPDGLHVVYVAQQATLGVAELFSVAIDGSAPSVKVSGAMTAGGDVMVDIFYGPPFEITPDGSEVVYLADQDVDEQLELYRAPTLGGGPSVKVSGALTAGGDVGGNFVSHVYTHSVFQLTDGGADVGYMADADVDDQIELYVVPLDGSAPAAKLSATLAAGADVVDFGIAPGSQRVAYRTLGTSYAIHGAPLAGGPSVQLGDRLEFVAGYGSDFGIHGFRFTPDGAEVLFAARPNDSNTIELLRAPLDGSRPAAELNGPLVGGGDATAFGGDPRYELTADGGRVVYVADQDSNDVFELFATFLERRPRRAGTPTVR